MAYLEKQEQLDQVRPGEQWFFYWKTSPALWDSKLSEFHSDCIIVIPLYWGLHEITPGQWDFFGKRTEGDLSKLVEVLRKNKKKYVWLLPLSPFPHLPNGGLPVSCARSLAMGDDGIYLSVFDNQNYLNKMYSFFNPKVFKSFINFVEAFSAFLGENDSLHKVLGAQFYYFQKNQRVSFFNDRSQAFEQGFSRFLKTLYPKGVELKDPQHEEDLKKRYTQEAQDLFISSAQSLLQDKWVGVQKISVLGSSPEETLQRSIAGGKSQSQYLDDLLNHFVHSYDISSALLGKEEKKEILKSLLKEIYNPNDFQYGVEPHSEGPSNGMSSSESDFQSLLLVEVFSQSEKNKELIGFLKSRFQWAYKIYDQASYCGKMNHSICETVKIFLDSKSYPNGLSHILKLFLMGEKVILNSSSLNEDEKRLLNIFIHENNIKVENVFYETSITIGQIGEKGTLILYDGIELKKSQKSHQFWNKIFEFFNVYHPEVRAQEEVYFSWKKRNVSDHELTFLDVRRVYIYNPTSYKKMIQIKTNKQFAFMKMVDPIKAKTKSHSKGVDVELLPQGKIALDFGYYDGDTMC